MHAITRQHRRWYNSLWTSGMTDSQKELIPFIPDEYDRVSRYEPLGTDKDTPSSGKQMPFGLSCKPQYEECVF